MPIRPAVIKMRAWIFFTKAAIISAARILSTGIGFGAKTITAKNRFLARRPKRNLTTLAAVTAHRLVHLGAVAVLSSPKPSISSLIAAETSFSKLLAASIIGKPFSFIIKISHSDLISFYLMKRSLCSLPPKSNGVSIARCEVAQIFLHLKMPLFRYAF